MCWRSCKTECIVSTIIFCPVLLKIKEQRVIEVLKGRSTVSIECNGAINFLSEGDLIGQGLLIGIGDGIFGCARVANSYIWITTSLSLAYFDGPW